MKVSDLGKRTSSTPPYGSMIPAKKDNQYNEPFPKPGKYPDSQDLMGGPQYKEFESASDRAFHAKTKLEDVAMKSFGRYHA